MNTKEQLLALFEQNRGTYFSGETLAEQLQISRTAVWKAVNALRGDGYPIVAAQNKGYALAPHSDILSAAGVEKYLAGAAADVSVHVIPTVDSTNTRVKEIAGSGEPEGYVLIASQQTAGRGRRGHSFFSPEGTGVYLSILLRPHYASAEQASALTTMAAVAVCEAIEDVSDSRAQIKWVNDVFIGSRKVCGILTEASFSMEDGSLEYAVLGVGINAVTPEGGFPEEIRDIAAAVFSEPADDGKNRLAAAFLNRFMAIYTDPDPSAYVERYRRRCMVIGREVQVISPTETRTALALDVDSACRLIVRFPDGHEETLFSGEIRVKL